MYYSTLVTLNFFHETWKLHFLFIIIALPLWYELSKRIIVHNRLCLRQFNDRLFLWRQWDQVITSVENHDDVMTGKRFPDYWPFVSGSHRWPVYFLHKGSVMRSLDNFMLAWTDFTLNKPSSSQWSETPWHSCDITVMAHNPSLAESEILQTNRVNIIYACWYGDSKGVRLPTVIFFIGRIFSSG